eukprot:476239-Prorocentrum_minimum.AAC.1
MELVQVAVSRGASRELTAGGAGWLANPLANNEKGELELKQNEDGGQEEVRPRRSTPPLENSILPPNAGGGVVDDGVDAGVDAEGDAGIDDGVDAEGNAGVDDGVDDGVDAGVDAGVDDGVDAGVNTECDAGVDAGVDAG